MRPSCGRRFSAMSSLAMILIRDTSRPPARGAGSALRAGCRRRGSAPTRLFLEARCEYRSALSQPPREQRVDQPDDRRSSLCSSRSSDRRRWSARLARSTCSPNCPPRTRAAASRPYSVCVVVGCPGAATAGSSSSSTAQRRRRRYIGRTSASPRPRRIRAANRHVAGRCSATTPGAGAPGKGQHGLTMCPHPWPLRGFGWKQHV